MREISIAMFLQIQSDSPLVKQKKVVLLMRSVPISGAALFANARKVSVDKFQIKN